MAYLAAGESERARGAAEEELERARRWGTPSALGIAELQLGLATGDEARLEHAAVTLATTPCRLELAKALLALGVARRRANRRSEAREPLRRALDLAARCGAEPVAADARTELAACGARPRRALLTGRDSLTASERRVAELVAQGLSNPEVARALVVSRSTVESHLKATYRKLDVGSREELRQRSAKVHRGSGMRAGPPPEEACEHDDHRAEPRPARPPRLRSPHARAAFHATAAAHAEQVALRTPGDGLSVTWAEYTDHVRDTAARLAALGVGPGDTVGLLLTMRPEVACRHRGDAPRRRRPLALPGRHAGGPRVRARRRRRAGARHERSLAGLAPGLRRACPNSSTWSRSTATRRAHRARRARPRSGLRSRASGRGRGTG